MNNNHSISVFTPSNTPPEDLEFILVQRHNLLEDAVERVRESALSDHKHHLLFVGPRGCGKTFLVTLIVYRVGQDKELEDRLRIAWLNEDETCTSLLELLIKIHAALEKRYPGEYRGESLDPAFEMKPDAALEFISKHVLDSLGSRTLMVAAENLDAIFENLGDAGQKQLRAFIQENPRLCFVATAQRLVESLSNRANPFYGFFQTEHLKPLNADDATELLTNIARLHKNDEIVEFLATSRGQSRVQALHHLSGGNHRIYIVLSQFITRDSIDALVGPFMKMVDELTPYYQERVRWLPPLQRKIVEYLCACEITVPVKEIAKRLFSSQQTISSQLQSLREKGYVESNQRGRESLYEISEPLMRICVEVKENQRNKPLRLLVDFLRVWYDDDELTGRLGLPTCAATAKVYLEAALERNKSEGSLRKKLLLKDFMHSLQESLEPADLEQIIAECETMHEAEVLAAKCFVEGHPEEAISCLNDAISHSTDPSEKAALLWSRAELHGAMKNREQEIEDYSSVIGLSGAPVKQVASALFNRGVTYGQQGDNERAIEDYTTVIGLSGAPVEQVAKALFGRGITYGQKGDSEREIEDYTAVVDLSGAPVEQVAMALVSRGVCYGQQGDNEHEFEDYTTVINLPGAPVEQVAMVLVIRGLIYSVREDYEHAIEDYTAVIGLPGAPVEQVAKALLYRGASKSKSSQWTDSRKDFEQLIHMEDAPAEPVVDSFLALTELNWNEGKWDDGFATLDAGLKKGSNEQPAYVGSAEELISVIFRAGLTLDARLERIGGMLRIYQDYGALPKLGDGLVKHLGEVFRAGEPYPSSDNLQQWFTAWEQAAGGVDEFRLPLRLMRVGIDFVIAGGKEPGILLTLTSAEREILKQALRLAEGK